MPSFMSISARVQELFLKNRGGVISPRAVKGHVPRSRRTYVSMPVSGFVDGSRQLTLLSTDSGRGMASLSTNKRAHPASTGSGGDRDLLSGRDERLPTAAHGRCQVVVGGGGRVELRVGWRRRDLPPQMASTSRPPCRSPGAATPAPRGPWPGASDTRRNTSSVPGDACATDPWTDRAGVAAAGGGSIGTSTSMYSLGHVNSRFLTTRMGEVNVLLQQHRFDILSASETWLRPSVLSQVLVFPCYHIARCDRTNRPITCVRVQGGGS